MDFEIENFLMKDFEGVIALLQKSFKLGSIDQNKARPMLKTLMREHNDVFLVAKAKGAVVGFIHVHFHKDPFRPELKHATLWYFAIDDKHRNKGYGLQLFDAAVEQCKHLGVNEIRATTSITNIASQRVAEHSGFKKGISYKLKLQ